MHLQIDSINRNNSSQGLAVDIDDTLAASVHRWMFRLDQEFPAIRQGFIEDRNLSIDGMVKKYPFAKDVPYWGGNREIHARLVQIRTDPAEILKVEPIVGAVQGLNRIHEQLAVTCYFSTRPESLREATRTWLKQAGFPDAELILTPETVPNSEAD